MEERIAHLPPYFFHLDLGLCYQISFSELLFFIANSFPPAQ